MGKTLGMNESSGAAGGFALDAHKPADGNRGSGAQPVVAIRDAVLVDPESGAPRAGVRSMLDRLQTLGARLEIVTESPPSLDGWLDRNGMPFDSVAATSGEAGPVEADIYWTTAEDGSLDLEATFAEVTAEVLAAIEGEAEPHKFSCVLLKFPPVIDQQAMGMAEAIPAELVDVDAGGIEAEPHVTVLYGLETDDPSEIVSALSDEPPVGLTFGAVSYFDGSENDNEHDVVWIEIFSEDLRRLNGMLRDRFEYTNSYDEYVPHMTLAYVKRGSGPRAAELAQRMHLLQGRSVTIPVLVFSSSDGERLAFRLGGSVVKHCDCTSDAVVAAASGWSAENPETPRDRLSKLVSRDALEAMDNEEVPKPSR